MGINSPGVPGSNLPANEAWLVRRVADLERTVRELAPSIAQSIAPTVARLDAADAAFVVQQATLTTTVAGLATAQATLATTVSGLASAVADISTLVEQQTTGTAGNATTGGTAVTLTTTPSTFATITIDVPTGYTVAAVEANTSIAVGVPIGAVVNTRIGAVDGPSMNVYTNTGNVGNGSSNFSRVFAVTPGGTFTVQARASVGSGTGSAIITNAASVTFYR